MEESDRFKEDIICYRMNEIKFDENGELLPYVEWVGYTTKTTRPLVNAVPVGASGILYPINIIDIELICNMDKALCLCAGADDIWYRFVCSKSKLLVKRVYPENVHFPPNPTHFLVEGLARVNLLGGGNDRAIRNIAREYGSFPWSA